MPSRDRGAREGVRGMSLWDMSGSDLAREIGQPAPVTVLRGGHNGGVAGIIAQIAQLPPKERDALMAAFQVALKPEPKRLGGGNTFKGFDDFMPAYTAARLAAREAFGERWYLFPEATCYARLPVAWANCHIFGGVKRSPRDVHMPKARFWPGGVLPTGPDYAEYGPVCPVGGAWAERARPKRKAIAFDLEPTPENIDMAEAA